MRPNAGQKNLDERQRRESAKIGAPVKHTRETAALVAGIVVAAETPTGPYRVAPVRPDGTAEPGEGMWPCKTWPEGMPLEIGAEVFVQWSGSANPARIMMSGGGVGLGTVDATLANRFFSS